MKSSPDLIQFIKEARKRGFNHKEIITPLLNQGWPLKEINKAFSELRLDEEKVTIYLDSDLIKLLQKRAKKNYLTLPEQIEDILRRSCISLRKTSTKPEKLDDALLGIFSRAKRKKAKI